MPSLDSATLAHLDKWLDRNIRPDSPREDIRARMVIVAESDPEHWLNAGWWRVYDEAGCEFLE